MSALHVLCESRALASWYDKAGVRTRPRRMAPDDEEILKSFFPKHLVPHVNHPLVEEQEESLKRYLSAQHLYQWLNFTARFEVSVVCRATQQIAYNNCGVEMSNKARLDAYKILVDENYHALYSFDTVDQLEERSGIEALEYDFRPFLRHLDALGDQYPQHRRLVQFLQVVVFETLVTSLLNDVPKDQTVITVVRDVVRDHATDERRHHAYFSEFFKQLWGQLEAGDRLIASHLLPDVIVRSLQPATRSAHAALGRVGFPPNVVSSIIEESYDQASVSTAIRSASKETIRLFENRGVLDVPGARERFAESGLVDP
jgi:hypothetical protein